MGGPGSGNRYRWNKQTTIEEIHRIDIRYLKKNGWLVNDPNIHTAGKLSWTCGGEPDGFINAACYHNHLKLDYKFREEGGDWLTVNQTIRFESTPCHYGGSRKWFSCPQCLSRIGILCGAGKLFLCRRCYQLPYSSQMETVTDRLIRQKHKLGNKLFESYEYGEGWNKKKGMHWKTFDRLNEKYQKQNELCSDAIEALL